MKCFRRWQMNKDDVKRQDMILEPDPVIEAYKKDVDHTLIRENLRLSVEQRVEDLMWLQEIARELQRAGRETAR
jgi:hypothetical protein